MITTHSDAANAAQTLAKILRLERQGNFRNRAVVGGLDAFLRRWQAQLRPVVGAPVAYADMDGEERGRWVADTLARIGDAPPSAPVGGGRASRADKPPAQSKSAEGRMPRSPTQSKQPAQAKPARKRQPRRDPAPVAPLRLDDDISRMRSVSARAKPRLERLGIQSVHDLIYHFPHRHDDFTNIRTISQLVPGEPQSLIAAVWEVTESVGRGKTKSAQAVLSDHTGNIRVIWFNQSYIKNILKPGMRVIIRGEPKVYLGRLSFQSPDYEIIGNRDDDDGGAHGNHQESLQPVYPLTDGLYQRTIRRIVKEALDGALGKVADYLPGDILRMHDLMPLRDAIARMHHPESAEQAEAARRRLAFDELLMLQLTVAQRRAQWQASGGAIPLRSDDGLLDGFLDRLPYSLTAAQAGALSEILGDMRREIPMGRLLQGDVGSGKTVVAIAALLTAALNGCQAALMAPTEILAEQHFLTAAEMLSALNADADAPDAPAAEVYVSVRMPSREKPLVVGLLTGSLSKRAKDEMHRRIAAAEVDIVIGTQALIQAAVEMPNLALVVVDEQHRFGVMQRNAMRHKSGPPHMLVMSATPIPRSLALTLCGDLDLSTIDELPPGRQPVKTRRVEPSRRHATYDFVRAQIRAGRQAFIICPLVEESEAIQARAATEEYERLSKDVFPDLRLGLLHGRMGFNDKEAVMSRFQDGEINILVSTPVIEVGIDVPNASVMLIDGAERFGLAQLHQFRGRVGRGAHQSYCLLLSDAPGAEARERLKIMERVSDGFQLAEEDLRIRGPGDYMGTRQSGILDMKVARISDQDILLLARKEAARLLTADPDFAREENAPIAARLAAYTARAHTEVT